jgi:DNA-directed RNA polymerase alpha subunit
MPLLQDLANCGCLAEDTTKGSLKDILKLKSSRARLEDTGLNIIDQNILTEGGIHTVRELINKTEPELLKLRRMNYRALANIEHILLGSPESPSWDDLTRMIEQRYA